MAREEAVMTVKEFAEIFKLSDAKARNIFRASVTLKAFKLGNKWVCAYKNYLAFLDRLEETRDVALCLISSIKNTYDLPFFTEEEHDDIEMVAADNVFFSDEEYSDLKLLLLNGCTPETIERVLIYGKEKAGKAGNNDKN